MTLTSDPTAEPVDDPADGTADESLPTTTATVPRRRMLRRFKRATIVTHRWLSLILGIVLVVLTTTGAFVVFSPEWTRWSNSSTFDVTHSSDPIPMSQAIDVVRDAHPEFDPGSVNLYSGLYEVSSTDDEAHPGFYGVDPGTGDITGYANPSRGVMAFFNQVHECFFTCDDYPGYIGFLDHPVPTLGMHWLQDVTWAGFTLGVLGLLLLFLAVSGIWLWWPGIRRLSRGFRVRTKRGRFARDYDLHQVIGMAALPFLLMWGLTGASFEFHWVSTAWYSLTGGKQVADVSFESAPNTGNRLDITLDDAVAAGRAQARPGATLVYVSLPAADDDTAYYDMWFSEAFDQYRHGAYPGQLEVAVDRHDATNVQVNDYGTAPTLSNKLLDTLGAPTFHYGQSFNAWWRIIWFLVGLTPLALMITGLSTWFYKRGLRKRKRSGGGGTTPAAPAPLATTVPSPVA